MKRVALDFDSVVSHVLFGAGGGRAWHALGALAFATGALALAGVGWQGIVTQRALDDVGQAVALRSARVHPLEASPSPPGLTPTQLDALNQATRQLNLPWGEIFLAIEERTAVPVALLSIEPDAQRHAVRIQAEAPHIDSLLAYASQFRKAGPFDRVELIKHETNEQDAAHPMRLSFDALLRAPAANQAEAAR
jgi:hypothetical protein